MEELSKKAVAMIRALHKEAHAYGKCQCDMSVPDELITLDNTLREFDAEIVECAAEGDVDCILELRRWFAVPPLI